MARHAHRRDPEAAPSPLLGRVLPAQDRGGPRGAVRDRRGPARARPAFFSVTYGAGGSTHDRRTTLEITRAIRDDHGVEAMAHLSCVGETAEGLRGDPRRDRRGRDRERPRPARRPAAGQPDFVQPEGGLGSAAELAGLIADTHPELAIGGACFPEVHPEADSLEADLAYLKTKVDTGATFLITQLFFDNRVYFDFVPAARGGRDRGPDHPRDHPDRQLQPGRRTCELCDATIPASAGGRARGHGRRRAGRVRVRGRLRAQQCAELLAARRPRNPLLRAQPLAGHPGDPGALRAARPWEGIRRRAPSRRGVRRAGHLDSARAGVRAPGAAGSPTRSTARATARSC